MADHPLDAIAEVKAIKPHTSIRDPLLILLGDGIPLKRERNEGICWIGPRDRSHRSAWWRQAQGDRRAGRSERPGWSEYPKRRLHQNMHPSGGSLPTAVSPTTQRTVSPVADVDQLFAGLKRDRRDFLRTGVEPGRARLPSRDRLGSR